jgi:hypothetical protein
MTISDGKERYYHHRRLGKSSRRRDGSQYNPTDDERGFSFEKFAAEYFGYEADDRLYEDGNGDEGVDIPIKGLIVGCYCPGIKQRKDGSPARLIKNLYDKEPHIHVVGIRIGENFEFVGWVTHSALRERFLENREIIHGSFKLTWPLSELWPMDILDEILIEDNPLEIINALNE